MDAKTKKYPGQLDKVCGPVPAKGILSVNYKNGLEEDMSFKCGALHVAATASAALTAAYLMM